MFDNLIIPWAGRVITTAAIQRPSLSLVLTGRLLLIVLLLSGRLVLAALIDRYCGKGGVDVEPAA